MWINVALLVEFTEPLNLGCFTTEAQRTQRKIFIALPLRGNGVAKLL
jgi:hypothetical protein